MKYDVAVIFKKVADLMPYYYGVVDSTACAERFASRYAKERPVNLVLLIRYEYNYTTGKNRILCKINCPINPLPVKGEFEAPSVKAVERFLLDAGWTKCDVLNKRLFE